MPGNFLPKFALIFAFPILSLGTASAAITNALKLKISNVSYSDETVIRFLQGATEGFDSSYDAYKLFSSNPAVPAIYTRIVPAASLSINAYPALLEDKQEQVFASVGSEGEYTITATEPGAFAYNVDIFIEDLQIGKFQNLRTNPVYTFYVSDITAFNTKTAKFKVYFSLPVIFTSSNIAAANGASCIITKKGVSNWTYTVKDNFKIAVASDTINVDTDTLSNLIPGAYTLTSYYGNIPTKEQTFQVGSITLSGDGSAIENYKFFFDKNTLTIDFNNVVQQQVTISLYTMEGRELAAVKFSSVSRCTVPLEEQPTAVYIVKLQTKDATVLKKVSLGMISKR